MLADAVASQLWKWFASTWPSLLPPQILAAKHPQGLPTPVLPHHVYLPWLMAGLLSPVPAEPALPVTSAGNDSSGRTECPPFGSLQAVRANHLCKLTLRQAWLVQVTCPHNLQAAVGGCSSDELRGVLTQHLDLHVLLDQTTNIGI